jgi:LysM repeat protein
LALKLWAGIAPLSALVACATPPVSQAPVPVESAIPAPTAPPVSSAEAVADEPAPVRMRRDAPLRYVVQPGDTLWSISNRYLLDPWQWPEIWFVNGQVANPHLIYPGDTLLLSVVDGQPRVGLDVERLSPQIRESAIDRAIPTIPIDAIRDFLRGPRLVTPEELAAAPYLLAFIDEHLIGSEGNGFYARKLGPDERYALVRPGRPYRDPDDGKLIGYEAIPVGEAELRERSEPAQMTLTRSFREALVGDRLLPAEDEAFRADFYPHAPDHDIGGRIIAAFDGISQIAQYQIVALNRGSDHGVEPGHVLQILRAGALVDDPYGKKRIQLPDQPAGQLLVFKTAPRLSFALIMSVTRPAEVLDKVERPRPTP